MRTPVIGTRGSALAKCQAQLVQARLEERFPKRRFALEPIRSRADRNPDVPLSALSGEGIFVKELEAALGAGRIDLAVHSLKDLPLAIPPRLRIAAVLEREEPRDALISRSGEPLDRLPSGACIGTSSLRRQSQLLHARSDLRMVGIRGNVDTRLRKLDEGQYDAIVVAACGLIRLGLEERISEYLDLERMLPEPGQGALAVEARCDDQELLAMLAALEHPESRTCTEAERAFLRALGGGCRLPIAAYASVKKGALELEGALISPDGRRMLRDRLEGSIAEPIALGERLAAALLSRGAQELLARPMNPRAM